LFQLTFSLIQQHHQDSVEMVTTPMAQRTNITSDGSSCSGTMVATPAPAPTPAPTPPGNMVAGIEKQQIVEEAERRCRGELEHMRREIETLKESLSEQVDSEDVSLTNRNSCRQKKFSSMISRFKKGYSVLLL